jgi:hypothetical protein
LQYDGIFHYHAICVRGHEGLQLSDMKGHVCGYIQDDDVLISNLIGDWRYFRGPSLPRGSKVRGMVVTFGAHQGIRPPHLQQLYQQAAETRHEARTRARLKRRSGEAFEVDTDQPMDIPQDYGALYTLGKRDGSCPKEIQMPSAQNGNPEMETRDARGSGSRKFLLQLVGHSRNQRQIGGETRSRGCRHTGTCEWIRYLTAIMGTAIDR